MACEPLEDRRVLAAGALDLSFGDGGKVLTDIEQPSNNGAYDVVAYQSDGKALAAGYRYSDVAVVRYNTDGSLDTSFGDGGVVTIDFGAAEYATGVVIDSQDRIVVAGYSYQGATGYDFAVARLTSGGALDTGFDGDGKQTIDFGSTSDYGWSVAVDSGDNVLVAGYSSQGATGADFAVARLTSGGALDTGFDGDGKQTIDFGSTSDHGYGVAVDSGDNVLVAGFSFQGATANDFAVARLTSGGALDTGFDGDGRVLTDLLGPGNDSAFDVVAQQSDGKLVVAGQSNDEFAVVRYNTDGSLDTSFGDGGVVTIDFGNRAYARSVTVDSQDRILVAGYSAQGHGYDFAVARLTSGGALDTGFDGDGKQTIDFGSSRDYGQGVAVDSGDNVLVAGYSNQGGATGNDFAVARLTSGGALDTGFDGDGKQTIDFGNSSDVGYGVAVDSGDNVLVAGYSNQGATGNDFAVTRLTSGGALDTGFDGDGKQTIDFGSTFDHGYGVAVDSGDNVLVAGDSYQGATGDDFAVTRLTSGGGLDTGFDGDGKQTIDFGSIFDHGYGVAVDSGDNVLVAGYSYQVATRSDFAVARLLNNEPPTLNDQSFSIEENSANGTVVGTLLASDPDLPDDTLSFTLVGGSGAAAFNVDSASGQITVADGTLLDFEATPSLTLEVQVTDSAGASDTATVTIHLVNVTAVISGTVFVDVDGDGVYDGGSESGIDGVNLGLYDATGATQLDADVTELGGVYAFVVDDEFGTYRIRETQPTGVDDGAAILGDADGAVISSNEMQLTLKGVDALDYFFTEFGQAVQAGDTATIGFWQSKHGQALIAQGGPALVNWLNTNFGNIFGSTFSDGIGGDDAAEVATFYKNEFFRKKLHGTSKVDAQFMSLALSAFFTSSELSGGAVAATYGFNVTDTGIGTKVVNVGDSGAAFNVDDNKDMTIMALLHATNELTGADTDTDDGEDYSRVYDANGDGVLDDAENALRAMANEVYSRINESGDI